MMRLALNLEACASPLLLACFQVNTGFQTVTRRHKLSQECSPELQKAQNFTKLCLPYI